MTEKKTIPPDLNEDWGLAEYLIKQVMFIPGHLDPPIPGMLTPRSGKLTPSGLRFIPAS